MTPDGERLGEHPGERPVERRLRQALDARADSIDVRRLRPASPPGARAGRPLTERLRRFALPLAGLVAAAAAGIGYLLLAPEAGPGPQLPATPPRVTTPSPSTGAPPSPSPSRPGPTPSGDASQGPSASPTPTRSAGPTAQASPQRPGSVTPSHRPSGTPGAAVTSSPPSPGR
ncbi:hypothetical protein [Streptomyces sp. A0592]|uniref:hypothetical protein n=1 Tax=Streptomyces sp. A0592 TaxID=2563099 RepID=UPI00109EAD93|nr:hypothetical protein [Streptomyces sp. A0592]THA86729.1 hypothetical protein E6U81_01155 [Streptomyces sp. A0592]